MTDLKTKSILVTPTSYGQSDPRLKTDLEAVVGKVVYNTTGRPLSEEELIDLISDIDGCIAGLDPFTRQVFGAAQRLQVVARYGVGVDAVDLVAAKDMGVLITNTPGANAGAVGELAVGFMLALARDIPSATALTRQGKWARMKGISIEGKTVGLIGFGEIGQVVAKRLSGFECQIWVYDPFVDGEMAASLGVALQPLDSIIREADFISLHCPLTPETRALVDTAFLEQMKPTAFLINTARGEIVDEAALVEALDRGLLQGAALDVLAQQPPSSDHPLLQHPRVIATPHMGAHTDGAKEAMGWGALNNCLAALRGEEPANRVV